MFVVAEALICGRGILTAILESVDGRHWVYVGATEGVMMVWWRRVYR